jgi:hypothetical protein
LIEIPPEDLVNLANQLEKEKTFAHLSPQQKIALELSARIPRSHAFTHSRNGH